MRVLLPILLVMSFSSSANETLNYVIKETELVRDNLTDSLVGICEPASDSKLEQMQCEKIIKKVSGQIFELGVINGKSQEKLNVKKL